MKRFNRKYFRYIYPGIVYLTGLLLSGMLFFTVWRLSVLLLTQALAAGINQHLKEVLLAFIVGWRFDIATSGYILIIPAAILTLSSVLKHAYKWPLKAAHYIALFGYALAFLICCIDIPFFRYFSERLNGVVFATDTAAPMVKAVLSDWRYYLYLILFGLYYYAFYKVANIFFTETLHQAPSLDKHAWRLTLSHTLFALLLLAGIRGRVDPLSPLRTGTAYFSNYAYANKLALNPVFSFAEGAITHIQLQQHYFTTNNIADEIDVVRQYLHLPEVYDPEQPLLRAIAPDASANRYNVVLILMESMASGNMQRFGNTHNLTPFLDSLAKKSLLFTNFYSAGTHTNHGIYSTLTGYPCLPHQHSLIRPGMEQYEALPEILRKHGYQTTFYTSHDAQLDNIAGFCKANGFQKIYSAEDYPSNEKINAWGVPDHYLLDFAIRKTDEQYQPDKPFFSTILTISNHPPYMVPPDIPFKARSKRQEDRAVEYADYALEQFFKQAEQKPWFHNTVFVLVADHGRWVGHNPYEFVRSFVHVPLLMYAPGIITHAESPNFGNQTDVVATVMGVLGLPYYNNTFGVDLRKQNKAFTYFCSDDKLGYIDSTWFYYNRITRDHYLYAYRNADPQNYATDSASNSAFANRQLQAIYKTAQWMVQNSNTSLKNNVLLP